jgi:hypothetical protein
MGLLACRGERVRAFVVGNGVSLKQMNLDLLIGEVSFAMNRIDLLYEPAPDYGIQGTSWRPTYYLFLEWMAADHPQRRQEIIDEDPWIFDGRCAKGIKQVRGNPFRDFVIPYHIHAGENVFLRSSHASIYGQAKMTDREWATTDYKNITWLHIDCPHAGMDINSSGAPTEWHLPRWCKFGGTLGLALQFAFAMGYDPVYVIGCDLGFQPIYRTSTADPNHFHPFYWTWDDHPLESRDASLTRMHQNAKDAFDAAGRHIFNAGVGGELQVYPRVDFEEIVRSR